MSSKIMSGAAIAILLATAATGARAADIMPDFGNVPTGWSTDRYAPDGFSNVGTYQGRSNVLGIGIGPNGATANRPSAYQSNFYSTQGDGHAITGGAGDSLGAALYVPRSWSDAANGARRTDMWGVMTDGTSVTDYPIIGFTNYGTGTADLNSLGGHDSYIGFRAWNGSAWIDLSSAPVNYGAWNSLAIDFTGTEYQYVVNGVDVADVAAAAGTTDFSSVLMQAFNFDGNTYSPGAVISPYTADWSNVPEPGSLLLLASGILGLGFVVRRRRQGVGASALGTTA